MERAAWTDERLDDLIEGMRNGFTRVDQDVRELRSETRTEFGALRTEMREGFASVRSEINELRRVLIGMSSGIIIALIGVIAAILARGA